MFSKMPKCFIDGIEVGIEYESSFTNVRVLAVCI
jgi:hypothetical protein